MNVSPRDYQVVAHCLSWLSHQAGRALPAPLLLASLTDGRDELEGFDVDGLATALGRVGLGFEAVEPAGGKPAPGHLPALVLAEGDGPRVYGVVAREGADPEVRAFSAERPEGEPAQAPTFRKTRWFRVAPRTQARAGAPRDWFWSILRGEAGTYGYVVAAAMLVNLFALGSSLFTMAVYDRVIPNNAMVTLWTLAIGVTLVLIFDTVFRILRGVLIDIAARRVDVLVSRELFEQLLGMRLEHRIGAVGTTANMMREFATIQEFFSSATLLALVDLPFVLLFVAVVFAIAPACGWVVLVALPLVALAGLGVQGRLHAASKAAYLDGQDKHGTLVETLTGLEAVRGLGAERVMRRRWRDRVVASALSSSLVRLYSQLAVNLSVGVQQLASIAVVVVGVIAIRDGTMSQGALIAAVLLTGRALAPLASFAQILSRYHLTRVSMEALTRFMSMPVERPEGRAFVQRPAIQGGFAMHGVAFAYPAAPPATPVPVLGAVELVVRPGERVAVLGRVGSGKSTLVKLMLGMFQPSSGSILVDGIDIRQVDPAQLRDQVAYVAQAPLLFSGTVRENIAIARPDATDAEVIEAARLAGADAFIDRHPQGYDAPLAERGEGLSVGQRQAIALAQALIKDAKVLVMDEPTSAFDDGTEEQFKRRLAQRLDGKTLILVTHKLSMIELCDRVVLVDGGRIAMDGPRERVLRALMGQDQPQPAAN